HLAFQPHPKLLLAYTLDALPFFGSSENGTAPEAAGSNGSNSFTANEHRREGYGMFILPGDVYLRAGRFKVPFGLNMDDHTVATREGFLGTGAPSLLPYDPRDPDAGMEIGLAKGPWFGRTSLTKGNAGRNPEAKAAKLGFNTSGFQGAVSIYDDFVKLPNTSLVRRETRWGLYGLSHYGWLSVVGEVAAGTDD